MVVVVGAIVARNRMYEYVQPLPVQHEPGNNDAEARCAESQLHHGNRVRTSGHLSTHTKLRSEARYEYTAKVLRRPPLRLIMKVDMSVKV